MKVAHLFSMILACGSFMGAVNAVAQNACEPISDISCQSWRQQAQVVGDIVSVQPVEAGSQQLCKVTIMPTHWSMHALCPLHHDSVLTSYEVCGSCPETGSTVSGVLMSNGHGLVVLDY